MFDARHGQQLDDARLRACDALILIDRQQNM
jgi:hypothetical protein